MSADLISPFVRWRLWLLALVCLIGCADVHGQDALWVDPGVVQLSPAHTHATVEIHNRSGTVRPVGEFALAGPDWGSLRFVDDSLPRTIPGHGSVRLELEVSRSTLLVEKGRWRSGSATLNFGSDQFRYEVPIEFVGSETRRPGWPALLPTLALVVLAVAGVWPLRDRLLAWREASWRARSIVAAAFGSLLLAAALIPIGFGVCAGRLAALVGPRELAQCRADLGGAPLLGLDATPVAWAWMGALAIAAIALTAVRVLEPRGRDVVASLSVAGLRLLGFALLLGALAAGLAPADASASELVRVQTTMHELAGVPLPRWGLFAQPLGAALGLTLLLRASGSDSAEPLTRALERLEAIVWAAVWVSMFLGGPALPVLSLRSVPVAPHGVMIAIELSVFVAKLAAVAWLLARLQTIDTRRLASLHARVTVPLALAHALVLLLWAAA